MQHQQIHPLQRKQEQQTKYKKQGGNDRVIPDREHKFAGKSSPDRRGKLRHSLQLDTSSKNQASYLKSPGLRQSQASLKEHKRKTSKEIILYPFRHVAKRFSKDSLFNKQLKENSNISDLKSPAPFHNATTSPEPKLHVPQPSALRDEEDMFRKHLADDDYLSDTLSEKYPLPYDENLQKLRQKHEKLQEQQQLQYPTQPQNPTQPPQGPKKELVSSVSANFPILVVQSLSKYTFTGDVSGAELALKSLRNLSLDRNMHKLLSSIGSIRACISCMERFFSKNVTILMLGLLFLGDISRESEINKKHIGQNGGLQLINRILLDQRIQDQDFQLLERACITLRTICANCDYNTILSGVCGTIETVLKLMRRFKRSIAIQERCLDILTTVIRDASENIDIALDLGIISEVLVSIRQYPDFIDIQISASRTVCELARANDIAREDLVNTGLLVDIYKNLLNLNNEIGSVSNSKSLDYILSISRCIRYLAFSSVNRSKIVNHTNLSALFVQYLSKYKNEKRICISLLQALANITYDEDMGKYNVVQNNGTFILLNVLDIYLNDVVLSEAICRVLRNASDGNLSTKKLVGKHNCVFRISKVIHAHIKVSGIQEHSFATLINLWPTHEVQIRALAINPTLMQSMEFHSKNSEVMRQINALKYRLDTPDNTGVRTAALLCLKGQTTSDRRMNKASDNNFRGRPEFNEKYGDTSNYQPNKRDNIPSNNDDYRRQGQ